MASQRTNGSGNVLRRRPKTESKKDGEIDSESIISEFFKYQSVFKPDVIKWKEPEKSKEKPKKPDEKPEEKLKEKEEKPKEKLKEKQEPPKPKIPEPLKRKAPEPAPAAPPMKPEDKPDKKLKEPKKPDVIEYKKDDDRLQFYIIPPSSLLRSQSYPSSYPSSFLQYATSVLEQIDVEAVVTERTSNNFQESSDSYHLEWIFIITNIVLEILLVVLDQIASPQKPEYALTALAVSTIAIFVSLFDLYLKARRQGLVFKREGLRFWFDHSSLNKKQFCNFIDAFGLICAFCQLIFSGVGYSYHRRHADNPVNISIVSLMFIICLAFSKLPKKKTSDVM